MISDLHLGDGGRIDEFGHRDADFLKFLDHLEGNFEKIVLLGDVYETLTCARPRGQVRELRRCREAHLKIAERFERPNYRYIHGNHDLVAGNVDRAPDRLTLDVDGTRILFTHGHHIDWVVTNMRWFSEWLCWVGGWAFRAGLKPLRWVVERIEEFIRGESSAPDKDRFQRAAIALAQESQADIVVTGHTHNGGVYSHGDRLFMNSGSCSAGEFSFLSLDTARGHFAHQTTW